MCKQNTRQGKEHFNNSNPDFTVTEQTAHVTHISFLFRSVLFPSVNPLGHFKHTPPIATGTVRSRKSVFPIRELFFLKAVSSEKFFYHFGQPVLY